MYFFSAWFSKQDPCFSNLSVVSGEFSRFGGDVGWTKGVWCCFLLDCSSQPWRRLQTLKAKNHTSGAVLWWQTEEQMMRRLVPATYMYVMYVFTVYEDTRMQIYYIPGFPSWLSSPIWKQEAFMWTPGTHQVKRWAHAAPLVPVWWSRLSPPAVSSCPLSNESHDLSRGSWCDKGAVDQWTCWLVGRLAQWRWRCPMHFFGRKAGSIPTWISLWTHISAI